MAAKSTETVDVIIVGAGLSGIGAAYHLQQKCPGKNYVILESRDAIGGTWDLFRYPGIRSDSDMYTLGYAFKPWTSDKSIADGPSILQYVRDTAAENGIDRHIRFNHKVTAANWQSDEACWTVTAKTGGKSVKIKGRFLLVCSGYYSYDGGYEPKFPGSEKFRGEFIHPQKWPENLDYAGKRVVIIGSGATAVTLVPAMAKTAEHVTMLQRSPTYIVSMPEVDALVLALRKLLPETVVYDLTRWRNVLTQMIVYQAAQRQPKLVRRLLLAQVRAQLGKDFDVEKHFSPKYNPWDQRLCLVPDGDMFKAIREKRASVVTDDIETFTAKGIRLKSGEHLDADIIVSATGLNLVAMGGAKVSVDGVVGDAGQTLAYKGMMLNGIPNFVFVTGYTNASWTLKADLISEYVCRLLKHMDKHGHQQVRPVLNDPTIEAMPIMNLNSGYVQRAEGKFPQQGNKLPWRLYQNYFLDMLMIRWLPLEDKALQFGSGGAATKDSRVAA